VLRSLIYFWPRNLAVAAGAAIATAVLTGALIVGDSMQSSLQKLTLDRLGEVDYALTSESTIGAGLASRISEHPLFPRHFDQSVPALMLRGAAVHGDSEARASAVNIYGVTNHFATLFPGDPNSRDLDLARQPGQLFPSMVINEALSQELGAEIGDAVLLSYQRLSSVPSASLLGSRESEENIDSLRLTVRAVLPDRQLGRFGLQTRQHLPLNAFVSLESLQESLDLSNRVNALLFSGLELDPKNSPQSISDGELLRDIVGDSLTLDDIGLRFEVSDNSLTLESQEFVLRPQIVAAATRAATMNGFKTLPIITYLANNIQLGENSLPYSTVSALPPEAIATFEVAERSQAGSPSPDRLKNHAVPDLQDDEILLNRWAADDLGAEVGDELTMKYYVVDSNDELEVESADFRVAGVVEISGLAGDPELTPAYPGISDSSDMSSWDPPFPIDLNTIRPKDEDYWDRFQATPKAFVTAAAGSRLWRNRFGELTSLRIENPASGVTESLQQRVTADFLAEISPASLGFEFRPVKAQGLEAAKGATDFTGLFLAFSLFLIVSAALLVGLLFNLSVDRRAQEIGLLLSVGFPLKSVRNRLLVEGGIIAAIGCLAGTLLAIVYAKWLIGALGSWWSALIDSPFLAVNLNFATLAAGYLGSLAFVIVVIWWTIRRLTKSTPRALLAGSTAEEMAPGQLASGKRTMITGWACITIAALLLLVSLVIDNQSPALFFGIGASLCAAGIALFASWCKSAGTDRLLSGRTPRIQMAMHNSSRNPGRSLLSVALVSSACFVLVSIGASHQGASGTDHADDSGTGGFTLVATAETPLDTSRQFRQALPKSREPGLESSRTTGIEIFPMRLLPGEDASCLNLYQPEKPRILGIGRAFMQRGSFKFRKTAEPSDNPWNLLLEESAPGVIPAIADYNSAQWILHRGLGDDLVMQDGHGDEIKLRLVGLLETSIFQSEILISEAHFLRHFPDRAGYSYFLLDSLEDSLQKTSEALEARLSDYGLDTVSTATKLVAFKAVENMYLKTFQVLGGLGLLLGTVGLGIVVVRNVIERRAELATLRAFGFRRSVITLIVLIENAFLLIVGIGVGAVSGLVAVAPHLLASGSQVPWPTLIITIASVFGVGMGASAVGVITSLRVPLLPVLKTEGIGI
jgi:ABC-type lipoprotein release transport system permease subunit